MEYLGTGHYYTCKIADGLFADVVRGWARAVERVIVRLGWQCGHWIESRVTEVGVHGLE